MTMKHYIHNLRKVSDQLIGERKRVRDRNHLANESLETQIQRWWVNLPPAMRERRFQIVEIAAQCRGRFNERPALRKVACALRVLGWHESRDWSNQGKNRRYWQR